MCVAVLVATHVQQETTRGGQHRLELIQLLGAQHEGGLVRQQQHDVMMKCPLASALARSHLDLLQIELMQVSQARADGVPEDGVEPDDSNPQALLFDGRGEVSRE
ncbi:hypothetical protein NR798_44275 [Archangium gephyra]